MDSSVFEYFNSIPGVTLKEDDVIQEDDAICCICHKSVITSPTYTCAHSHRGLKFYIHKTCSKLFILLLDLHLHPLNLETDVTIAEDAACHVCNTSVIGSPIYTCIGQHDDDPDADCLGFYLHKSCAELPKQIDHHKHNIHPLSLRSLHGQNLCVICDRAVKACYACSDCDFNVCVACAFEQRVLHHQGHKEHTLTLMKKEAFFKCDACYEEAKDSSYVCTICEFWIHKSCAFSPSVIPDPTYHHHPLTLVYSIPHIHRYFSRFCGICSKKVHTSHWLYYCHKCTYFVHMKCSTSTVSMTNEIEAGDIDNEPDLVQFPLPSQEAIFDLIVTQCAKFEIDFKGEVENSIIISPDDPLMIEKHWSHQKHPLQQLKFTNGENENDDSDDDREVLICDGCIQPITVSHPIYYACIQCGFFLHSFCALKLPHKLPVGASLFHPNHSLLRKRRNKFYSFAECGVCCRSTNGFYYDCETCDIKIDIRCAFLPTRIKHKSHKRHSLVQRPASGSKCNLTHSEIESKMEYACETCSSFQIDIFSAFLPSSVKHKYDNHPITLRIPPFFYEGVFYCEICEEQVNNQLLLYHCDKSDHSFHIGCLSLKANIKCGGTIKFSLSNQPHTFALVFKETDRKNRPYICSSCRGYLEFPTFVLECVGCGELVGRGCFRDLFVMFE